MLRTRHRPRILPGLRAPKVGLRGHSEGAAGRDDASRAPVCPDSSPCGKAALPLAGIVVLEVKDSGKDPSIMDTFERELFAECKAQKTEDSAKDALACYDKNHGAIGYRLFKACPEQPGRALVDAVVAKHGRRE
jgi:hypothetical protein